MNEFFDAMAQQELADYTKGAPSEMAAQIDSEPCDCDECQNGQMIYIPFTKWNNGHMISYRAFMVCQNCDNWFEF